MKTKIIVALMTCLALSACSKSETAKEEKTTTTTETTTAPAHQETSPSAPQSPANPSAPANPAAPANPSTPGAQPHGMNDMQPASDSANQAASATDDQRLAEKVQGMQQEAAGNADAHNHVED